MSPKQEPHENLEPTIRRPREAPPTHENSPRQTFPTAESEVALRPTGSDIDGGPSVSPGIIREPRGDEEYVMRRHEKHTDGCNECTPEKVHGRGYGDRPNCEEYAFDVIQYLCCVNDQVYSLVDTSQPGPVSVRVDEPREAVWTLLRAMKDGLHFDSIDVDKLQEVETWIHEIKDGLQGRAWVGKNGHIATAGPIHRDSGNLGNRDMFFLSRDTTHPSAPNKARGDDSYL